MDAHRGVPAAKRSTKRDGPVTRIQIARNNQRLGDSSASGPLVDGVQIVGKPRIGQVGVAIEQLDYPSRRGNSGGPPGTRCPASITPASSPQPAGRPEIPQLLLDSIGRLRRGRTDHGGDAR